MYEVRMIEETDLPTEQGWMMVRDGDRTTLLIKQSAMCPQTLADAWAAGRMLRKPRRRPALRLVL